MSTIRANTITDTAGTGAPTFSNGIVSNGNVGIGTSSPSAKLDVVYTGLPFRIANSTTSGYALAQFGQSATATQNWHIGSEGDGTFRWYNGSYGAGTERMRIDASGNLLFNSGYGSVATAYGCRAWVNFNGTGTVAIRASGNVTSITDNGVGDYTINFTTAMPDASYAVVATSADGDTSNIWNNQAATSSSAGYMTASSVRIATTLSGTQGDTPIATVTIFR